MFLKRLEVIGFKSFADRVGIDFVPGVTAVVGPNGSGKSNVTDAIRWVLGEQSAKSLRGAKMEDVIFAGSDSRKALNFAEVTLVLDNTDGKAPLDYSEISVTRRVFRSGESAYLLNKQACRLKDITDLFMDSGLGKEAFSIISQGRVDEILNSKADERRSIFEEAAGVLKYKQRKRKAEFKLNETDENLNRVLDILHELDGRMEPLQMQASSARDYLDMSAQLKDADIALLAHDANALKAQLSELSQEAKQHGAQEQQLASEISETERLIAASKKSVHALDKKIDAAQVALVEASSESEKWEGRKLLMSEKKHNADRQRQALEDSIKVEREETVKLEQRHAQQSEALEQQKIQQQNIRKSVHQLEAQLNLTPADIDNEIEMKKSLYIELMNEQAGLKNELKNIDFQQQQMTESSGRIAAQEESFEKELDRLLKEKQQAQKAYEEIHADLDKKRQHFKEQEASAKQLTADYDHKKTLLFQAYQSHKQLTARIDTLQDLEADYSGFFHGVREVLQARERNELSGIIGAVAELADVQKPYAKAIETAFGAASQHIVTSDEKSASEAIRFLRTKRAGRSTFLPMTVIKPRQISQQVVQTVSAHPAFVDIASQLVSYDEQYAMIFQNLLGHVLVAKDLEGATSIAKAIGHRYRVVTLEGDVINAGGSMTGGATKNQASFFTRKAELEQLQQQAAELQGTIAEAEGKVRELQSRAEIAEQQLEQLRTEGERYRELQAESAIHLREIEAVWKTTDSRFTLFRAEQQTKQDLSGLENRKQTAAERMGVIVQELESLNDEIEELTGFKQQKETARGELLAKLAEFKSDMAVRKERIQQLTAQVSELVERHTTSLNRLAELERELEWIQSEEASKSFSDEEIEAEIQKWSNARQSASKTVDASRNERQKLQHTLDEEEQQLREQSRIHKGFTEAVRICEVKATRLEVQLQGLLDQLVDHYEMDLETASRYPLEGEEAAVRKQVKLLKQSIDELGSVNISAIEEYEHVAERHRFLSEQRDDLNEAKDTLRGLIEEMDEEMTLRFDETFHAIRSHFRHVFRELFGGGSADLVLTKPSDLLMTGVDIIAQPPGKKLQNLSLLSGGERALTAIALLFAILKVRPVPFCVLDEVEAALDESNVVRYSQYLKKFSEDTQFIVITHRKGTMEGADVLYGITMQESGISKLVSVKLQEDIK
ncbi:chromosome segregation protein SMC [Planococcus maritimus]|uniref:chromosome segregation protein SMC n=1 Tax=Planococcus maritimus TaxID=192421 RepID=UPI00080F35B6|nr:chromosome segregation protein SMC [Planococcus maritimus]ANU17484.1 chromosome segregation protein SMC [Planococcus maritimus]